MSPPETRTNISPNEMHRNIVSTYKELPPKANLAKALGLVAAVVAGYYLVFSPIASELGGFGETINIFGFMFAAAAVYGVVSNYFSERNTRQLEVQRRAKVKGEYDRMQGWYATEEHVHRNATKTEAGRAAYPVDWVSRKKYVRTRDGACYLCKGSRDNDRYYFYRARDGRHLNRSGKDFALYDQVHHIVPISKGGTHEVSNLVYLCNLCHEDQHAHLLRRRIVTLERKSKQARNPDLKAFWLSRHSDLRRRLTSLDRHANSTDARKLHRLTDLVA